MHVIDDSPARGDFVLRRGVTNDIGSRWMEDRLDGSGYRPKDLTGYTAELRMEYAGSEVYSQPCECTSLGLVYCAVPPEAFGLWPDSRQQGEYAIDATAPDGRVTRVAEGYWHMS